MASLHRYLLFSLSLLLLIVLAAAAAAESNFQISTDTLDQWETTSFYGEEFENEDEFAVNWRSLFWKKAIHYYYISYGALSANRIPCPPRSGRSYYTRNCHRARGPVHPYTRGCSAITQCRR